MSCDICGSRCQGRLCRDCELMERQEDDLEWRWDDLDDEEDDVDRGDGVATDGGNAEASLGAFETVAETLGISLDTLYRRLAHETPSNPREWEPPLPEAQEHAGAEEMHVALDVEPTTAQGGVSAELSDRVNQLYVEATTENVIFEVAEEFQSVSFSTTFAPDQAKAIGCALIAGSKRAADANSGVIVRKYNLAGVDRGDGIETDGGRINWPANFERTPPSDRESTTKFSISLTSAFTRLERSLKRIGVDDFDYEFDARQRQKDKRPYARANPDDPSFVVRWTKDGEQFAVACDRYSEFRDNVRAVGLYLEEKRKMENRPVATGESEFANARLPPADDDVVAAPRPAHEVLGVEPDASDEEIRDAFREAVKKRHPDKGGRLELFNELQEAKEAMLG
ncbi:J domain-containing protein [Haloferax sp. KTX1]|uniref:J domain-containing protein n=1 Tax=Haloferax sp. KTX1 TaxID=2600597 RepID=UPI002102169C|nr:J domain-containing protein [Haloferax sp. KTX1]